MPILGESAFFFSQLMGGWRRTGAILPSSPRLARAMVDAIGPLAPGQVVVELGPGTGVFTRELARRLPGHPIVAVEANHDFAGRLRGRHPAVNVVAGCASRLRNHLAELHIEPGRVGAVISGLPLLSLPGDLPRAILASITDILPPGGRLIQFTYSRRAWRRFAIDGLQRGRTRRIWLNVPPAVVMEFVRSAC